MGLQHVSLFEWCSRPVVDSGVSMWPHWSWDIPPSDAIVGNWMSGNRFNSSSNKQQMHQKSTEKTLQHFALTCVVRVSKTILVLHCPNQLIPAVREALWRPTAETAAEQELTGEGARAPTYSALSHSVSMSEERRDMQMTVIGPTRTYCFLADLSLPSFTSWSSVI